MVPVPSATALVLQMPRGNLETVHPRPMVGAVVKADVARYVHFLPPFHPVFRVHILIAVALITTTNTI